MEAIFAAALGAVVTVLGGDRVVQSVRSRRNSNGHVTKADLQELRDEITTLNTLFARHLGYHEGMEKRANGG